MVDDDPSYVRSVLKIVDDGILAELNQELAA